MEKNYLWTTHQARLQCISIIEGNPFNWIFLPGGPGLGSESLQSLTKLLKLPGTTWHLDLPGDGSNTTLNNKESFQHWSLALSEAVALFEDVILVAHSTGGMYALSTLMLEESLTGLVLMDSAPNALWRQQFAQTMEISPELEILEKKYRNTPSNALLKELTIASANNLFSKNGLQKGIALLEHLPYNFEVCQWSEDHFDESYQSNWIPQTIPTMILSGEEDRITPLRLFIDAKDFQRENICFRQIKQAGHFPWIENPEQVVAAFGDYLKMI